MKNRIITILLVLTAGILLSALALHVRVGATADSVVVLKTSGMTCPSCSAKITQSLERLKGVAGAEVDVAGGWVAVGYDTKAVTPIIIAQQVTAAGFGSHVDSVLTPQQFRQLTGRSFGEKSQQSGGCGCCARNKN